MKKFYKAEDAVATKDVGRVYHQVQDFIFNENYDEHARGLINDADFSRYIDYKINFPYFVLHQAAKLSDW